VLAYKCGKIAFKSAICILSNLNTFQRCSATSHYQLMLTNPTVINKIAIHVKLFGQVKLRCLLETKHPSSYANITQDSFDLGGVTTYGNTTIISDVLWTNHLLENMTSLVQDSLIKKNSVS
jgi:hypothetical protein